MQAINLRRLPKYADEDEFSGKRSCERAEDAWLYASDLLYIGGESIRRNMHGLRILRRNINGRSMAVRGDCKFT